MEFDVVIVGAGPAGLSAACRLGQLSKQSGLELSVCVVEKGSEVGAHIISGAVFETRALDELFDDWREHGAPVNVKVTADRVAWLISERRSLRVPEVFVPIPLRNHGNYVVSLGKLCRWLAEQAERLGCSIFPGFSAVDVVYDEQGRVAGIVTGDMGIARDGEPKPGAQPGYVLQAKYVVFAEGCRGNLGRDLESRFDLRRNADPQHYGLGLKEIWDIDPRKHRSGELVHTFGWPLDDKTEGGGFLYHADDGQVHLGLVVALNYRNPYLSPFDEFQRWKLHPLIRSVLDGGKRVGYGARAITKGGVQSLPKLTVPGGLLVGCDAGFLNGAKIKGSHTAMKSGLLAAEVMFEAIADGDSGGRDLVEFSERVRKSWIFEGLEKARNFSPGLTKFGTLIGGVLAFAEHNILRGHLPLTLRNRKTDHECLQRADVVAPIKYAAPDGVITFDRLSSVFLSNTHHEEDQPGHLKLADESLPLARNLPLFDEPAQRYCPAAVYEVVTGDSEQSTFQINASNCIHCKACEIKDPSQNIAWEPPEGGGGPNYAGM